MPEIGIGGGGMTTVVSILLSDIIPLRNRGTWQGRFISILNCWFFYTSSRAGSLFRSCYTNG